VDELTKEFIAESQEGLERMERCLTGLEKRPGDRELIAEIFRSVHTIKGTTGFLGFARLETLAHAGENLLGALRDGKVPVTSERISGLLALMDGLRAILTMIETRGDEGVRATKDDRDLIALLAALKDPAPGGAASADAAASFASPQASDGPHAPLAGVVGGSATNDRTLRIDVEVLNRMMNLVGELVLTRNQILQCTVESSHFPELSRRLDNVTADLRETVMQARMQPVGHLFGKFPRMVRDLAQTCGKRVRLEFEGQETGLDKSLLEAIKDPLTHAVRNAVDHGIERPEVRLTCGKAVEGVVRLRAFHHGGSVIIEVIDDGAGISPARVLAKAVERGLVTAEKAETMREYEAMQMIFLPGFSTAAEVTHVSGRGVGMDVVRENVEKVGGSVELESRVGEGTTIRLRVPLTLAIVPALVVRSAGESFALPQSALVELVYIPRRDAATSRERIGSAEVYRLRERMLPLVWLNRLLELQATPESHGFYIAVVESEGCRYGLVVDDLLAPEEIVVKPLSGTLREIGLFSGATVLGNGMLAMILDVAATGARAGVRPIADSVTALDSAGDVEPGLPDDLAGSRTLVIYESGVRRGAARDDVEAVGERTAIALSEVERIESVPVREIEYTGGRAVLQYRGDLLALEDEGGVLCELSQLHQAEAMATVLICLRPGSRGEQRVGVVVRRVLDVTSGTMVEMDEGGDRIAMVRDRVTTMHREFAQPALREAA
jgi:two-component system chemotaxis sensor kinase CheA